MQWEYTGLFPLTVMEILRDNGNMKTEKNKQNIWNTALGYTLHHSIPMGYVYIYSMYIYIYMLFFYGIYVEILRTSELMEDVRIIPIYGIYPPPN